jgi:hypothetical protein
LATRTRRAIRLEMQERAHWPKICRCGETWAQEAWAHQPFVGYADGGEDGELELRNCSCGSTLSVRRVATITTPP